MVILGIDPGLSITGYAAIQAESLGVGGFEVVEAGVFRFDRRRLISNRLEELQTDLTSLIERTRPACMCVESLFAHFGHPRTAIVMAHARGVILLTAAKFRLPLVEISPATVKKAVTGNGRATKAQMQYAVAAVLGLPSLPKPADVADAIAVAMCGSRRFAGAAAERGPASPRVKKR
ncbi:MAG: crossover junction endodeoxyribonuclease RuvC [Phycisphaerae bacterium]|nr:crossover junction endodeoxyribonuclease RuvC [Phycisphaerae bacterium]